METNFILKPFLFQFFLSLSEIIGWFPRDLLRSQHQKVIFFFNFFFLLLTILRIKKEESKKTILIFNLISDEVFLKTDLIRMEGREMKICMNYEMEIFSFVLIKYSHCNIITYFPGKCSINQNWYGIYLFLFLN